MEAGFSLWCACCGRREWCPADRMDEFARDGWPACCGRQMICWAGPRADPDWRPLTPDDLRLYGLAD